jgi:hypothetical protein
MPGRPHDSAEMSALRPMARVAHRKRLDGRSPRQWQISVTSRTTFRSRLVESPVQPCQTVGMARTYWLDLFTVETWKEFQDHGADVAIQPE